MTGKNLSRLHLIERTGGILGRGHWAAQLIAGLMTLAAVPLTQAHEPEPAHAATATTHSASQDGTELPVHVIPNIGQAAEFYWSPDSKSLIGNAKRDGDKYHQVYTLKIDGTDIKRINGVGQDACSFFFPDGKRLAWTSTRDNLDLPEGDWSDANDYPKGAEIYVSDLEGGNIVRVTNNKEYDAEVTVRHDNEYLVFSRQSNGKLDLWRSRPDGSDQQQITHLEGWEPGGSQYLPESNTVLFRAWKTSDQLKKQKGLPMTLFTVKDDGSDLKQLTFDAGTNWAPHPAPDGRHYVFNKLVPPHNYELFLGDLKSSETVRLTFNDAFDGFGAISPDGKWLQFSSSRPPKPGEVKKEKRALTLFLMDISSLNIGPKQSSPSTH